MIDGLLTGLQSQRDYFEPRGEQETSGKDQYTVPRGVAIPLALKRRPLGRERSSRKIFLQSAVLKAGHLQAEILF
ncbi:MAG: hypothetical protein ACREQ4_16350 [Candidatus Binataceae bacterium]